MHCDPRQPGWSGIAVLTAYEQLAAEGFIEGRIGSGCYVADAFVPTARVTAASPARALVRAKPRLARRGERMRELYDRKIPGRQHRGLRYNLQYGVPMTNPQLASAWRRELNYAAAHAQTDYPDAQGLPELRREVCAYLARRRGIICVSEDVLIVAGTQQAFALSADVLVEEGDRVIFEDPHYQGARQLFQARGAKVLACRVDQDGIVTDSLPTTGARLAVVTP